MTQTAQRAIAQSKAKRQQHHIGQLATVQYFGRMITGKIIEVLHYGTVVIETASTHRIRVSGLSLPEVTNTWKHDAPFNSQFLGAQPAKAGQDY